MDASTPQMPDGGPDGLLDPDDQQVLDELAELVARLDPVPVGLVERAQFAVALEEVEVEVARLLDTSGDHERDLAGVRGSTTDRSLTMTFATDAVTVTLAVTEVARERFRIDGWLTGGGRVVASLRLPGTSRHQPVGESGRFVFDDVPAGMVQVVVEPPDGQQATVVTPVFEL